MLASHMDEIGLMVRYIDEKDMSNSQQLVELMTKC